MPQPPVLIVGAGPTGLSLALTLAKQRVPLRIIEKDTKFHVGSRGTGIWPRTIEMHKFLGTLAGLEKIAGPAPRTQVFERDSKEPISEFNMAPAKETTASKPFNNPCMLRQQFHEELLRDELVKFEVKVESGVALQKFEQSDDSVTATLVHNESGNQETVSASYLVSAEGAHSTVRKTLGIGFAGETTTANFVIGDIEVLEGLPDDVWCLFGHASSKLIALGPWEHPRNKWHSVIATGPEFDYKRASESRDAFVGYFHELFGRTDVKFGEILQPLAHYVPNIRMVETFQIGRCFLAGDSAHVHPPTGGQGMNSGFQDSVNLGWKLGLVLKGLAPSALLDSYSSERLAVIAAMLGKTGVLLGKTISKKDLSGWDRSGDLDMLGINYRGTPLIVDDIHEKIDYDPYHSGPEVEAGDRAPDAPDLVKVNEADARTTRLFDIFGVTHHTALVFAKDLTATSDVVQKLSEFPSETVRTVVILSKTTSAEKALKSFPKVDLLLQDKEEHAYTAYNCDVGSQEGDFTAVIVRPDGYVGAMVKGVNGVERYFQKIFI